MVKKLSREFIKRLGRRGGDEISNSGGGGISPGAIEAALAGYAKEGWVNENYLSIEFFNRIFTIHGTDNNTDVDVEPNDLETTITGIEAMFGFWTEYYVSALGNGGDLGSTLYLSSLADVALTSPISDGQALVYNATSNKWVNQTITTTTALANLTDVLLTSPQANQVLLYDSTNSKWINSALKTINGQPIYGSGDLSVGGGASGNYLPLSGGTMVGVINFNVAATRVLKYSVGSYKSFDLGSGSDYGGGILQLYDSGEEKIRLFANASTSFPSWINVGSLGIGTQTPNGYRLYVNGSYFNNGNIIINGKLGVGTSTILGGVDVYSGDVNIYNNGLMVEGRTALGTSINTNYRLYVNGSSFIYNSLIVRESVGIGTSSPQYSLDVTGTIYATGSVTTLSDARKKDVLGEKAIGVEQIAGAPAVQFLWKDEQRRKEGVQVGSIAQYWQQVLPEVVMDRGGELSMQYGVAAMVSAIVTARKVVDHERRIAELERENERLKTEIEQLRMN